MIVILLIFLILGGVLVTITALATSTISGLRAFSTMQMHWVEARNSSTNALIRYLDTGLEEEMERFEHSVHKIISAREMRLELLSDTPDYERAKELLLEVGTHPRDLSSMITTFGRIYAVDYFSDAIRSWSDAETHILEIESMAESVRDEWSSLTENDRQVYIASIQDLDREMKGQEYILTSALSEGTHMLQKLIITISLLLVGTLLLSGVLYSRRFLRAVKQWGRALDVSEQRYKSLFERNPNAVFSISRDGMISSNNRVYEELFGSPRNLPDGRHTDFFLDQNPALPRSARLEQVLSGEPQSFKTEWISRSGDAIPVQVTTLPIFVDEEIVGAYVIAEDISYQAYAKQKIEAQLEEKTHLLAEVHDRVKNNLALISSLLQIQGQYITDSTALEYLDNTISRIRSMSLVHENIYQAESFATIRVDEFIDEFAALVERDFRGRNSSLAVAVDTEPLSMDIKRAIPFGLLINELINNLYAFVMIPAGKSTLQVRLTRRNDRTELTLRDDHVPIPPDFAPAEAIPMGMTLIHALTDQLNATFELKPNNRFNLTVTFREEDR